MNIKRVAIVSFSMISAITLAACNQEDWAFTKEEIGNAYEMEAFRSMDESGVTFTVESMDVLFNQSLDDSNILFVDMTKALNEIEEKKPDAKYLEYSYLRDYKVSYKSLETKEDLTGFSITFDGDSDTDYVMFIHKNAMKCGEYGIVTEAEYTATTGNDDLSVCINYCEQEFDYNHGGKQTLNICGNIAKLVANAAAGCVPGVVNTIDSMISSLADSLFNESPTVADVLAQLTTIENKMDHISNQLDKNYQSIISEMLETEVKVDKSILLLQNQNITAYVTDYVNPIKEKDRSLGDLIGEKLRDIVNQESYETTFYIYQDDDGNAALSLIADEDKSEMLQIKVTLNSFTNSLNFLQKNKNIVKKGFVDEFIKDIYASVEDYSRPSGLDMDTFIEFILVHIEDSIIKDYYSTHATEAQAYRDKVIELCGRFTNESTTSILESYMGRLETMYNFGSEVRPSAQVVISKLLNYLDVLTAKASLACDYALKDSTEMYNEFAKARKQIQAYYNANIKNVEDNYSYVCSKKLTAKVYEAYWSTNYTNKGNHPVFTSNLTFKDCTDGTISHDYDIGDVPLSSMKLASDTDQLKIMARWKLLVKNGEAPNYRFFYEYLVDNGIMPETALGMFNYRQAQMGRLDRMLLSYDIRDLNNTDTGMELKCNEAGNPDGDYFNVGDNYRYKQKHTSSKWSGRIIEGYFANAYNGEKLGKGIISGYANYAESHKLWINDEYWSFKTIPDSAMFYAIEYVA